MWRIDLEQKIVVVTGVYSSDRVLALGVTSGAFDGGWGGAGLQLQAARMAASCVHRGIHRFRHEPVDEDLCSDTDTVGLKWTWRRTLLLSVCFNGSIGEPVCFQQDVCSFNDHPVGSHSLTLFIQISDAESSFPYHQFDLNLKKRRGKKHLRIS